MDIKEFLKNKDDVVLMFRIIWTDPVTNTEEDDLFGYAKWVNNELIALDGDSYSLDYIIKWEDCGDYICCWEEGEIWSKDE